MYVQRGIDPAVATEMVNEVMQDPELALETHAREELGITAQSLGSPWQAAAASFVTFAIGAFIPLAPWLFTSGTAAIVLSIVLGAVASLVVGVVLARFTERPAVVSALRQLAVTVVAAGVTFGVGRAIGHRHQLTRSRCGAVPAAAGSGVAGGVASVRAVDVVDVETERAVQGDGGLVAGVGVEHPDRDAAAGE